MRSIITQSVLLPAPADALYDMYLDAETHAAITGASAVIHGEPGAPFKAFDGALHGTTLFVIPSRLIVQSWRSVSFHDGEPNSTLILTFTPEGDKGRIDLVHLDVPRHDYTGVKNGWTRYYWSPWKAYLKK